MLFKGSAICSKAFEAENVSLSDFENNKSMRPSVRLMVSIAKPKILSTVQKLVMAFVA